MWCLFCNICKAFLQDLLRIPIDTHSPRLEFGTNLGRENCLPKGHQIQPLSKNQLCLATMEPNGKRRSRQPFQHSLHEALRPSRRQPCENANRVYRLMQCSVDGYLQHLVRWHVPNLIQLGRRRPLHFLTCSGRNRPAFQNSVSADQGHERNLEHAKSTHVRPLFRVQFVKNQMTLHQNQKAGM